MASETLGHVAFSSRISEEGYKSIIVTNGDGGLVLAHVDSVDMSTIGTRWENSIHVPSEFAVASLPVGAGGVGGTTWVLLAVRNHEKQKLVSIADRSNVCTIHAPVDASYCGIVL